VRDAVVAPPIDLELLAKVRKQKMPVVDAQVQSSEGKKPMPRIFRLIASAFAT
jgi:hypothetical protein